jgi:hypothetical protein
MEGSRMADEKTEKAAVYVSWSTFKNALDGLAQGIPNRVDRSAFPGMAWSVQTQLLSGMKFLGLITEDHVPTPALHGVAVPDEMARKDKLRFILKERYPTLFALDLTKATPAQLTEEMGRSYNVAGETREKAVRFFLTAVEYAGVPVSRLFKPKTNSAAPVRRRRTTRPKSAAVAGTEPTAHEPTTPAGGTSRTVKLKSGGNLTVSGSFDPFALIPEDRKFVFDLIDRLEQYEAGNNEA